jgi:hypothetical protein
MHLLKKDTLFIWDERAQESFDALKKSLVSMPLLKPPDYNRDYFLYHRIRRDGWYGSGSGG